MKLIEGEKVILKLRPKKNLKTYWLIQYSKAIILIFLFLGMWIFAMFFSVLKILISNTFIDTLIMFILIDVALILVFILIQIIRIQLKYNKMYYWITNKRIVIRRGLIGYTEKSILIERLGEIIIVQTWLQRVLGIKLLKLELIGTRNKEVLPAIPNATEVKQLLLKLISEKRKAENLTY